MTKDRLQLASPVDHNGVGLKSDGTTGQMTGHLAAHRPASHDETGDRTDDGIGHYMLYGYVTVSL